MQTQQAIKALHDILIGFRMREEFTLKRTEPLALYHSWHLYEQERRFELGCILDSRATEAIGLTSAEELARQGIGQWHCDLADNSLTWSDAVYDIFEMPRGARVTRDETVALFCEDSRAAMERLRAYAIKHHRGFTLDAEIRPSGNKSPLDAADCGPAVGQWPRCAPAWAEADYSVQAIASVLGSTGSKLDAPPLAS